MLHAWLVCFHVAVDSQREQGNRREVRPVVLGIIAAASGQADRQEAEERMKNENLRHFLVF